MKNTNIFICHRPYHVLRSCDLMVKIHSDDNNVLILFNLKNLGENSYKPHYRMHDLEKNFNQVILINRKDTSEKFYTNTFREYYKNLCSYYGSIIAQFQNINYIYFFSDYERPVEILVNLLKKKTSANTILIDEGTATYFRKKWETHRIKVYMSEFFSKVLGYNLNFRGYGLSNLYNDSYAMWPELAVFHKPIQKLGPVELELLDKVYTSDEIQSKFNVIYVSSYINKAFGVPQSAENDLLQKIKTRCMERQYELYIKPHPIQSEDDYEKFEGNIYKADMPVELMLNSKTIVISHSSSALANANALGLKSICISRIFRHEDRLIPFFKQIGVYVVNNEDELFDVMFND